MTSTPNRAVVLTANDLLDGHVVYRTPDASWSSKHADARIFESETDAAEALAGAEPHLVVGPYLTEIVAPPSADAVALGAAPVRYREAVRALGPTMRRDLGKQAEGDGLSARAAANLPHDAHAVVLGALSRD